MTKVFVGMSGGVDSSLTAALLVEQGYEVTGVYMKNWSKDLPGMKCPWAEDLADAKRVAVQLGIDLKVFDFEKQYKQKVVDYMLEAYKNGLTPNPDIMCNQEIKFKLFLETSLENGADMIATGHYAKTQDGKLLMAQDENKDQTYFLYRITKDALEKTLFPVGEYEKSKVREMAKERNLYTAKKKDSQGICFVGQVGIQDFLSEYIETKPGKIIDQEIGKKIGIHDGAIFYTIGQRHGLNVGGGLPYYVVGKSMDKNEVYVSTKINNDNIWKGSIDLRSIHKIDKDRDFPKECQVRIRHRAPLIDAIYENERLELKDKVRAIASGQSAVIYKNNECLGGGIIA